MTDRPDEPGPPTDRLRLVQEVARRTLAVAARLQDNHAGHAAALALTPVQARLLTALQPGEPVPMRVLAGRIGSDQSNLTGLVDRLEAREVVVRVPDRTDRRVKSLVLTDAGTALRADFLTRLTRDAGPLEPLTEAQLAAVRDAWDPVLAGPGDTPAP